MGHTQGCKDLVIDGKVGVLLVPACFEVLLHLWLYQAIGEKQSRTSMTARQWPYQAKCEKDGVSEASLLVRTKPSRVSEPEISQRGRAKQEVRRLISGPQKVIGV